jgi:D-alanine-D-alanine ligase
MGVNMNIVVLCGGLSRERDVSLCTGSMVNQALLKKGHNAVMVDVIGDYEVADDNYVQYIASCREREAQVALVGKQAPDIDVLREQTAQAGCGVFGKNVLNLCRAADIVFMALHGEDGEDGKIQATFDMLGVKYTGSGHVASAVGLNKHFSKMIFAARRIPTPKFTVISRDEYKRGSRRIVPPCVVKTSTSGSSIGVWIVDAAKSIDALDDLKEKALRMSDNIVVEEYIKGREFTCGVLGQTALPLVEIIPNEGFYDYEHKYQPGATAEICPAELDAETTAKIQKAALQAHNALGMQVYSRSDFLLNSDGDIYCLEVNSLPGMTPTSLLPQEAAAVGIGYEDLCEKIMALSLEKYE